MSSAPDESTPSASSGLKSTLSNTSTGAQLPNSGSATWSLESGIPPSLSPAQSKLISSPHVVLSTLNPSVPTHPPSSPIPFLHTLTRLKSTRREGWCRFSLSNTESISDHMYRMSIITLLAPPSLSSRICISHCMKMSLVHDMAESLVGDITPVDGVSKEEKGRRESESMDFLTKALLGGIPNGVESGTAIREIWQEYEDNVTIEAKFVHDVDKFELLLQMMEYERREEGRLDLGEFVWVAEKVVLPEVRVWCAEVLKEREEFWKGCGKPAKFSTVGRGVIETVIREKSNRSQENGV